MSNYAELFAAAAATVDDDTLVPLVKQHVRFDKALTTVLMDASIPLPTREAVLAKLNADITNVTGAHYSNRSDLAVRSGEGGLALFAGNTTVNDPGYEAIKTIADQLGMDVAGLANTLDRLTPLIKVGAKLDPTLPNTHGRIVGATATLRGSTPHEVESDGMPTLVKKVTELTTELTNLRNSRGVVAALPHGFQATLDAFEQVPDDRKDVVKTVVDTIVAHHDHFVKTNGSIVGTDQVDYRGVLQDIANHSSDEPLEIHDGPVRHHTEWPMVVRVGELRKDSRATMNWGEEE